MEAISPSFGAINPGAQARSQTVVQPQVISISLPLRFMFTGFVALLMGIVLLIVRPDILATYHYNQYVISVTHLFTLGWLASIVMGAMYQLVPVALETKLHNERLARWQFVFHLAGVAGMVWTFWTWNMTAVAQFGAAVALGIGLFVYNIARTLKSIPKWNVTAAAVACALFWLSLTALMGLFVAVSKTWNISPFAPVAQMHAHAHLGGIGFFLTMTVGVSYKLVPMFCLSDVQSPRRAWWSIGLLNVGLLGLFLAMLFSSPIKLAFAFIVISALATYGWEISSILRARKRRVLDWGVKYFLTALGLLMPLSLLALVLCWPVLPATIFTTQLENVYGFLGLIGVLTLAILGMLYKIVPFLVWYSSYSKQIGRSKVPALSDLYSPRLQKIGYWSFLAGIVAVSCATAMSHEVAVRWSCVLLGASVVIFMLNMATIFRHLIKPRIEPLFPLKTK